MTDRPTPVVRVSNLRKTYHGTTALDGVDLDVAEGEVVVILGPSGSGKSTLVRCIDQLEEIDGGAIYLDDELLGFAHRHGALRPLTDEQVARQRRRMGMVFQQFNLFPHWTVLRNITDAAVAVHGMSRQDAKARAETLLQKVGLPDKAGAYPRQLSGGQQQRVAIARAVATRPRVLLFDEPTSALDPELVDEVLNVIKDLARTGLTMIVVTHEMEFARQVADRCVFMVGGKVVEQNITEEFFERPQTERLQRFLTRFTQSQSVNRERQLVREAQ
ncbi:amino acid ABC transporter ATP-binding protein [Rhodococcus jostii]|uniref:ABC-type polar-amino-acid transporter n=1 Tax=Rhodococcus jostii TaxID=132919 RepID=A0A1H5DKV9_RHOJO|nr:amino acid ABC transporter ATP-binding protein [Rhodococcus jostii]SED79471.1 amino acid ABC transporter ATP-binding protein, PAAT family [Rhodococcus jostii]